MEIPRFKAGNIIAGKESVVGNCNGHSCEERWELETPAFARAILSHLPKGATTILDYGCGVGRLAKEILKQNKKITVIGVDASLDELKLAEEYVNDSRFIATTPEELTQKVDLVYCIYVLQHVPAIELRHAIERMHYFLKPGGKLVYCSSDYRMAINAGGGFTDDQHLGVNIRREVERLFDAYTGLFDLSKEHAIIKDLVTAEGCPPGSIPHPAIVYKRREWSDEPYFKAGFTDLTADSQWGAIKHAVPPASTGKQGAKRIILQNRLAPGDILVMTAAIRSLHLGHPGKFLTDVEAPCMEIFENNPYITKLGGDGQKIDMHYPLISDHTMRGFHQPGAGVSGRHFSDGHRKFLEEVLEIEIPRTGLVPEIYLSQDERLWPSPVLKELGYTGRYWVLNAGSKGDYTLKQYHKYQEVVDILYREHGIMCVQTGALEHNHEPLKGVLDMRGKTNHRELYRLINGSDGVISCVSYPMHIAAALGKPCVVVAGGREPIRWEMYPNHRYLSTNGALPCCAYDGCWKSKITDCVDRIEIWDNATEPQIIPRCMQMIKPSMIADAVSMYYEGGILNPLEKELVK